MIWREKRTLLLALAVLLAANAIFFFTYRVQYQSRLDALDARLAAAEEELEAARHARLQAEGTFASYRKLERDVMVVFDEHWSTQPERLTPLIAEVKRLAVASSLVPAAVTYVRSDARAIASGPRGRAADTLDASEVGISFVVQGSYEQVRRLINLLELSQQFVIIDRIALASGGEDTLTLNLHLKTLFRDERSGGARNNRL